MPRFSYIAIDHRRKSVKGTVTAESAFAARKHLRTKGLHPTKIKETTAEQGTKTIKQLFRKNRKKLVTEFTRQLSTMLNAGIKLTEALSVLIPQIPDTQLRNTVTDIRDRVVTGESFADALKEYDNFFDIIYTSMMKVGEVTGTLPESLMTIANFMEKRQRIESKLKTAMIYPLVLIVVCIFAVIFLTVTVIPAIAEQIEKTGQPMPWITQAMVNVSLVLRTWWCDVLIAMGILLISMGTRRFLSTQRGAYIKDKILLSLPLFGPLVKQQIVARFASTLSTLLGSGLSMAESLQVVAEVTGNSIMNRAVRQARDRILSGADIATPLRESGVIDPTIAHMVSVGEKTGELSTMLKRISENMESTSDVRIERLSALTEPLIIVVMAIIIGIIACATLLPIIKYSAGQF